MVMRFKRKVLFLGAGFSQNYGGYLTTQLWEHIYNQPDISKSSRMRSEMRERYNVEDIPDRLGRDDRHLFMRAVKVAFAQHEGILDRNILNPDGFHTAQVREWLASFAGGQGEVGCIFTVNVDLLVEKLANEVFAPTLPGLPPPVQPPNITPGITRVVLDPPVLQKATITEQMCSGLNLIKLHGSINWRVFDGRSKTRLMVFGNQKTKSLKRWPLLKANFSLFKKALNSEWVSQAWIVGYGFGDEHINEVICRACEDNRSLGLYVIAGATRPEIFFRQLRERMTHRHYYVISERIRAVITNSFSGIFHNREPENSVPLGEILRLSEI